MTPAQRLQADTKSERIMTAGFHIPMAVILMLILIVPAHADQTISDFAMSLSSTSQSATVSNIENFVLHNFNYEFHQFPQENEITWETRTGDCTDRSLIIVEMLEDNGFKDAKTVHGYVYDENGEKFKHDWVEVTIRIDGTGTFDKYEKIGNGIW